MFRKDDVRTVDYGQGCGLPLPGKGIGNCQLSTGRYRGVDLVKREDPVGFGIPPFCGFVFSCPSCSSDQGNSAFASFPFQPGAYNVFYHGCGDATLIGVLFRFVHRLRSAARGISNDRRSEVLFRRFRAYVAIWGVNVLPVEDHARYSHFVVGGTAPFVVQRGWACRYVHGGIAYFVVRPIPGLGSTYSVIYQRPAKVRVVRWDSLYGRATQLSMLLCGIHAVNVRFAGEDRFSLIDNGVAFTPSQLRTRCHYVVRVLYVVETFGRQWASSFVRALMFLISKMVLVSPYVGRQCVARPRSAMLLSHSTRVRVLRLSINGLVLYFHPYGGHVSFF